MSQIRRRRLLVDAKLQGALLSHVALYWFYCLLSVGVIAIVWIVFAKRPTTSANLFHELWMNCGPALLGSIALLPLVQSESPSLAGLVFAAVAVAAVLLGKQPNGMAGLLFDRLAPLRAALTGADRRPTATDPDRPLVAAAPATEVPGATT